MQHSIAAKYVARPAARFPHPAGRERERRLGLSVGPSFQPAASRLTVLRPSRGGLQLSGWRPVTPGHTGGLRIGVLRPAVSMTWAGPARAGVDRRSAPTPAPWRG